MLANKHNPTRTYGRAFKTKEEGTSILDLGHGEIPVEYESACRFCLERSDVMSEVFGDLDSVVPITVKIKFILGLEVHEDDRLPTLMCDSCLRQLNDAYCFKKRSLASDVTLRQYLCTPIKPVGCYNVEETRDENGENEDDSFTCYKEEDLMTLQPLKEECTIDWDDQVPLAAIITSIAPEIPVRKHFLSPLPVTQIPSPPSVVEVPENYSRERRPRRKRFTEPYTIINPSSGYSRYVSKAKAKSEESEIDLDDIPLSERIQIEERRQAIKRGRKTNLTEGEEISDNSNDESGSGTTERYRFRNTHVCHICSKAFLTPSLLARHLRTHTGERPFQCDICDKMFSQKEVLARHVTQVHTDFKPHKCKYCGKAFSSRSILSNHIKSTHMRVAMFRCKLCPKVFRHASGLSRHQYLHNGTFFFCNVCNKQFLDSSSVKRHVKLHPLIKAATD